MLEEEREKVLHGYTVIEKLVERLAKAEVENARRSGPKGCWSCYRVGHWKRDCPSRKTIITAEAEGEHLDPK